jgi:hypothetical protein
MSEKAETAFDAYVSPILMPATGTYFGGSIVKAYLSIAEGIQAHHVTITEAFLQISLAAISTTPALIGGATLAAGVWLKHVREMAKEEREFRKEMARAGCPIVTEIKTPFPFDRKSTAKPSEDTVDVP